MQVVIEDGPSGSAFDHCNFVNEELQTCHDLSFYDLFYASVGQYMSAES